MNKLPSIGTGYDTVYVATDIRGVSNQFFFVSGAWN